MKLKNISFGLFLLGNILLLSLSFSCFILPLNDPIQNEDLVYCPLQKTWVKRNLPQPQIVDELENICASDKLKNLFSFELTKKTISFQVKTEKLFFSYLQKGDLAFVEINHHSNLPNSDLAQNHHHQKAGTNFRQEIGKQELGKFTFGQNPRPPTLIEKTTDFESQPVQTLEKISRNINPRSPPFSI